MNWDEVARRQPILLNIGGNSDCHPAPHYQGFISVDLEAAADWSVAHDLTTPLPLPDRSVSRIITEHCLEHLHVDAIRALLTECHRVLRPDGVMRIAVPDYGSPRENRYLGMASDPRHTDHQVMPTFELIRSLIEESPFRRHEFFHYWKDGAFVQKSIDYSLGFVKRTPDNDPRCRRDGWFESWMGRVRDAAFMAARGFNVSKWQMAVQRGRPLRVTSIVVDIYPE
jgi:predicted SAM-dependent methyltransferase